MKRDPPTTKMGITWEKKYSEFKRCVEMPEKGTPLHTWQQNLNAKIQKGSIEWSERRVKLSDCVEQKNCTKIGNAWEKKYAEFESYDYDGMPERGTQLYLAAESVEYQD